MTLLYLDQTQTILKIRKNKKIYLKLIKIKNNNKYQKQMKN